MSMWKYLHDTVRYCCHSPRGECGLKYDPGQHRADDGESLPARGVWIEMTSVMTSPPAPQSHSPRGECGLKCGWCISWCNRISHSPRGECGLKFFRLSRMEFSLGHSPRGECGLKCYIGHPPSPPLPSLPARGVWIEIQIQHHQTRRNIVTPREGSVD